MGNIENKDSPVSLRSMVSIGIALSAAIYLAVSIYTSMTPISEQIELLKQEGKEKGWSVGEIQTKCDSLVLLDALKCMSDRAMPH